MRLRAALTACLLCGAAGAAETVPAAMVLERLEAASVAFRDAATVPELSGAVLGFEAGLADLGDGLRETAVREIQLSGDLQRREAELSRLLSLLMRVDKGAPVVYAMHPASLVDAARAGMLSAEVDQALQTRARQLRKELDELSALRRLQDNAESVLTQSLRDAEAARAALGTAMTERTDLNLRFAADLVRLAILTSSASTLEEFLAGLPQISATPITPFEGDIGDRKGELEPPVQDVMSVRSEGDWLRLATGPKALVTAPVSGTIRYRGPLLGMGNAVILEPQADALLILAGIAELLGVTGEVIDEGAPLGFMGGEIPETSTFLSLAGDPTGAAPAETLYIGAREGGRPVDPATWFRTDKDG